MKDRGERNEHLLLSLETVDRWGEKPSLIEDTAHRCTEVKFCIEC